MRRDHRKTRTGCSQCKKRRVKCDEKKPSCENCLRNFLQCSLQFLVPSKPRASPPMTRRNSNTNTKTPNPLSYPALDLGPRASSLDEKSAALLHHYTCFASLDFGETRNMHVWQVVVPQMALAHDFLMHGILAISALHLSRRQSQPSRKAELVQSALRSENLALPAFRQSLSTHNSRNIHAVFAFSGLVVPYMLAISSENFREGSDWIPRLDGRQTHWFHSLRGVAALLDRAWGVLVGGPLGAWLMRSLPLEDWGVNPDDVHFVKVYEILHSEEVVEDEELRFCRMALDELRRTASLPFSPCRTVNRVSACLIWPGSIPKEFMMLLDRRKPEALVVLAHYCVQLKKVNSCWNFEGVGENMLRAIDEELGEEWKLYIEWALKQPLE